MIELVFQKYSFNYFNNALQFNKKSDVKLRSGWA